MCDNLTPETQNNILCPKELDVRTAICQYMQTSGYYVEYMHFNNNGKLDGFLDHKIICMLKIMNTKFVNKFVNKYRKHIIFTILIGQSKLGKFNQFIVPTYGWIYSRK